MAVAISIFFGFIAYELHKKKIHSVGVIFDVLAVVLIFISWR